jgi:hypothetical protein
MLLQSPKLINPSVLMKEKALQEEVDEVNPAGQGPGTG